MGAGRVTEVGGGRARAIQGHSGLERTAVSQTQPGADPKRPDPGLGTPT
ncbi:hypothetical protein GLE_0877 [Lysobacter enzymogenes]|uniref:Uncharacterized protein n=1 Tax=Lysobacter enzymogenes TaxID=69 RepID=A0A0S2DCI4_LYSEN|nr:hypothetical protein GLE_0877 [Lysobacter enzymogenes]